MLENITKKKTYLVYQVGSCEQGSDGWSSRYFPCVAQGNTKEEVINNWVENVKTLYGVSISPKYNAKSDSYYDDYGIYMNELILDVYGDVEPYKIENCFRKHNN